MLKNSASPTPAPLQKGFSLIEMMIAITIAIIVTGAAIALLIAILRSNGDTINSTRLSQELRAVNEVVVREIRRSRYVADPISAITMDEDAEEFDAIAVLDGGECIVFGYQMPASEAGGAVNEGRVIRFDSQSGQVFLGRATFVDDPVTELSCGMANVAISSPVLRITAGSGFVQSLDFPSRIDVVVEGELRTRAEIPARAVRSSIHVRSARLRRSS